MGSAKRCNSLKMAFVSQDAADNVKLHIPTYRYALPGLPYDEHDEPECHTDSKHQASSEQVRQYAAKIANRVVSAHFVEEVLRVALEGKLKKVSYMPRDVEHAAHILCRHVVQATGFDGYGGNPHLLGVPLEIHSSHLRRQAESLHGKRVLLVGSGKSSDSHRWMQLGCFFNRETRCSVPIPYCIHSSKLQQSAFKSRDVFPPKSAFHYVGRRSDS
jgi:lysine/ornithine N-monooxygenase